jgi:predicted RNase H-like HicB family nuclease
MEYIAYVHKDKRSDFGVSFPDFPGVVTAGKTLEEARRLAPSALTLHIKGMLEDGEQIPDPSSLDELAQRDPDYKSASAVIPVSVKLPDKLVRINVTARESQIKAIDQLADKAGMSRSAYMVQSTMMHFLGVPGKKPPKR